jgi:thiamine-phosphate pyrophosphorylase
VAEGEHVRGTARSPGIDVRLIVITDADLARPRPVAEVVAAALEAGAPVIQLRAKQATAAALLEDARALLPLVRRHGARLVVNDRLDVALAAGADGVHLGPDDLPVAAVRAQAPAPFLIGYSTDDPAAAARAAAEGADYIGCGAVFGTTSKADAANEKIGTARLDQVARAVDIPVVGIGGIDGGNVAEVAATAAAGVAVIGAVMAAADPGAAARALLEAMSGRTGPV